MRLSEVLDAVTGLVDRRDAIYVLQNVTGYSHDDILIRGDLALCKKQVAEYEQKIKRLVDGEPLQYVLGKWDFCGIEFIVDRRALIPRPETELLAEAILEQTRNKQQLDILDVCTGSGCVGLSIAALTEFRHNIVLADSSKQALSLVKENYLKLMQASVYSSLRVAQLQFDPMRPGASKDVGCFSSLAKTGGLTLVHSDLLNEISGEFDIIVSNPPYILSGDMVSLPENIKNFEPHLALNGGADGLDIYRRLIPQSYEKLKPGGMIFLEIGPDRAMEIMQESGFTDIKIQKDYAGINRIIQGVKSHV